MSVKMTLKCWYNNKCQNDTYNILYIMYPYILIDTERLKISCNTQKYTEMCTKARKNSTKHTIFSCLRKKM